MARDANRIVREAPRKISRDSKFSDLLPRANAKRKPEDEKPPKLCCDFVTGDRMIFNSGKDWGISNDGDKRAAIVLQDVATEWLATEAVANKTAGAAKAIVRKFGGRTKVK